MLRLLLFVIVLLLAEYYTLSAIKVVFENTNFQKIAFGIHWTFTALFVVLIVIFFAGYRPEGSLRGIIMGFTFMLLFGKMVVMTFMLFGDIAIFVQWIIGKFSSSDASNSLLQSSRSNFLSKTALIAATFPIAIFTYGMIRNPYRYQIKNVSLKLPKLPKALAGLKIVQISDIHSGSFGNKEKIEAGIAKINAINADYVFFTGDIVNEYYTEMQPWIDTFKKIKAKKKVYSVLGNHDYGDYGLPAGATKEENMIGMRKVHRDLGWELLLDRHERIKTPDGDLAIIGIENCSSDKRFHTYGDLAKAYKGCEDCKVKLLLSHDPSFWDSKITKEFKDIDVTFSGHTHGAQFGIEKGNFKWSISQYLYKQWSGLYTKGNQHIYTNVGFGFIGYHGRVGILPEITVFEFSKG